MKSKFENTGNQYKFEQWKTTCYSCGALAPII